MKRLATDLPGGLEYRSDQRNRVYRRKFDWDEARRLRAEGLSYAKIGKRLGVTQGAIRRVVDPSMAQRMNDAADRWARSGSCWECGAPCVPAGHPSLRGDFPRCGKCGARANRRNWWLNDDGRLTVRCSACRKWLDESSFGPRIREAFDSDKVGELNRTCRACDASARRLYRHKRFVPCVGCGKPTSPPGKESRRTSADEPPRCQRCATRHARRLL